MKKLQWRLILIHNFTFGWCKPSLCVESTWNVMAHGDAQEGKWRGNWRMEWVAVTLHTTSERGVSSITTADGHTSAASIRLNWRPCPFKWTRPFRRKTKSGFCACSITFQLVSTNLFLATDSWPTNRCISRDRELRCHVRITLTVYLYV